MKICWPRPQLVFTFDNRFSSTGCAAQQSVRFIIFRLQASYLSATSHTGRKSCRVKSLYMKRFWAQHCGPPGWLDESDPAGVIVYVMGWLYSLPFPYCTGSHSRSCPAASWWNFQLLLYCKCTQLSVMSYVMQGRHDLVFWRPLPSLSGCT
jgi:hypothetical protein